METIIKKIQILKNDKESNENLVNIGKLYLQKRDILEARSYFSRAIKNFPKNISGYLQMGKLNIGIGNLNYANNYLSKGLDINPKSIDILLELTKLYLKRNSYIRADDFIQTALKIEPENCQIIFLSGLTKLKLHNIFYAKKYLEESLTKTDDEKYSLYQPFIQFYLGILNSKKGLYAKALEYFNSIKDNDNFKDRNSKNGIAIQNNLGYVQFRQGKLESATSIFKELIKNNENIEAQVFVNLAQIYWIQNKTKEAFDCLVNANKSDPKSWPWIKETKQYLDKGQDWLKNKIDNLLEENPDGVNVGMYLGCVIPNRYPFIEAASRHVLDTLKVGVKELESAGCCPAPGVFRSFDIDTWLTLGARNLTIAEDLGRNMCIMCNGCYGTLNDVNTQLKESDEKLKFVNNQLKKIGKEFKGTIDADHIVWILYNDIGIDKIKNMVVNKLGLNVAVHYGCHILKPIENKPWKGSFEKPEFLDELVEITGCKSIPHRDKLMCCGAGGGLRGSEKEISIDFTKDKMKAYRKAGIDIIVDCCPFCHLQLDLGQMEINGTFKDQIQAPFNIPVIYITQLLGLAMGIDPFRLGLLKTPQPKGVPPFIPVNSIFTKLKEDIDL